MSSIVCAIVYNNFVSKWAYESTRLQKRYKIDLKINFDTKDIFLIFYGVMRYMRQREFYKKGLELLKATVETLEDKMMKFDPQIYKKLTFDNVNFLIKRSTS